MALWDCYINSSDDFAIKQGFSIPEFVRQIPRLVDGNWKESSRQYQDNLDPPNPDCTKSLLEIMGTKDMSHA